MQLTGMTDWLPDPQDERQTQRSLLNNAAIAAVHSKFSTGINPTESELDAFERAMQDFDG